MASQRAKFTVGLFITCGIGVALLAFIWLGMSRFFEKGQYYAVYFNESVQGLEVDSIVKYRGVAVGRVESIEVAPDSRLIQVILKIETGQRLTKEFVAQLKSVGITGSMFVDLDRKKKGEPDQSPAINFPTKYPVISSKPSNITVLLRGIDDVLNQIRALDLEGISGKVKLTLDNINHVIADANVKGISNNLELSLLEIRHLLDRGRWDRIIASVGDSTRSLGDILEEAETSIGHVERTLARVENITAEKEETIKDGLEDFRRAMESANLLLESGTALVSGTNDSVYQLRQQLLTVVQNLERASENLNRLIEDIAVQPSQLIFGEPPPPRKPEE